jgi:hypothetical protein
MLGEPQAPTNPTKTTQRRQTRTKRISGQTSKRPRFIEGQSPDAPLPRADPAL